MKLQSSTTFLSLSLEEDFFICTEEFSIHESRVGHEAKPLKQYTCIRSSYFVVGLCVSTVFGPLRVSSRAIVTGH